MSPSPGRPLASRFAAVAFAGAILAAFVHFVGPGLGGQFNVDDPMNVHYYWSQGWAAHLKGLALFFSTYQRPVGGLYFHVLYDVFGLNPVPFHIVKTAILVVNVCLAGLLVRRLADSWLAGGLAALLVCYHAKLAPLFYLPSYIFDVLCFGFYVGALLYYVTARMHGKRLTWRQTGVFLLLSLGALESKEMAVTLPAIVILYECLYRPSGSWRQTARSAWPALTALTLLTAVYVVGKATGDGSLTAMADYRPEFTWARYWDSTDRFLKTLSYQENPQGPLPEPWRTANGIFMRTAGPLLIALWLKRRALFLFLAMLWILPLPVAFVPGRGGALLYLPLFALAGLSGAFADSIARIVGRFAAKRRLPESAAAVLVLAWFSAGWWFNTERENRYIAPALLHSGDRTWRAIEQACALQVKPNSQVYLVNDPFLGWDAKFILDLCFRDPSVSVWLGRLQTVQPSDVDRMDYVFTFEGDSMRLLRAPADKE